MDNRNNSIFRIEKTVDLRQDAVPVEATITVVSDHPNESENLIKTPIQIKTTDVTSEDVDNNEVSKHIPTTSSAVTSPNNYVAADLNPQTPESLNVISSIFTNEERINDESASLHRVMNAACLFTPEVIHKFSEVQESKGEHICESSEDLSSQKLDPEDVDQVTCRAQSYIQTTLPIQTASLFTSEIICKLGELIDEKKIYQMQHRNSEDTISQQCLTLKSDTETLAQCRSPRDNAPAKISTAPCIVPKLCGCARNCHFGERGPFRHESRKAISESLPKIQPHSRGNRNFMNRIFELDNCRQTPGRSGEWGWSTRQGQEYAEYHRRSNHYHKERHPEIHDRNSWKRICGSEDRVVSVDPCSNGKVAGDDVSLLTSLHITANMLQSYVQTGLATDSKEKEAMEGFISEVNGLLKVEGALPIGLESAKNLLALLDRARVHILSSTRGRRSSSLSVSRCGRHSFLYVPQ
ncbi:unnamed protein product [Mesocestoides corti]|uniref:Protein unc-13 homolog B n=1 Tax=Mesocestoides corti TaxID=53468 RepID=A0A0R3U3E7_MESCO|nr:unnamed protein product [Mesocestoides corti]